MRHSVLKSEAKGGELVTLHQLVDGLRADCHLGQWRWGEGDWARASVAQYTDLGLVAWRLSKPPREQEAMSSELARYHFASFCWLKQVTRSAQI